MKTYKASYKLFHNSNIKEVFFHEKWMFPLYIKIIFDRRSSTYKCNLFNLFIKPKYTIRVVGNEYAPKIQEIIALEEKLIEFVIDKYSDNFDLKLFKEKYDYYSTDILNLLEPDFLNYVITFLQDEGLPFLAEVLRLSHENIRTYDLLQDLKLIAKNDIYNKLIDNSFHYAPPYFPLFQFVTKSSHGRLAVLLIMDWENAEVQANFRTFLEENYPNENITGIFIAISQYINQVHS